jgi:hypothetical protein
VLIFKLFKDIDSWVQAAPKMPKNYFRLFLWLLPMFFDFARLINCNDPPGSTAMQKYRPERSIFNGSFAWDLMVLFSYYRFE